MSIVSVTRILNEEDIVEAFVRHHAAYADKMLFLDNGSVDTTLDILKSLQNEGFPLTVFQTTAAAFDETAVNTWLYHLAGQLYRAAWVLFLDADEFIATEDHLPTLLNTAAPGLLVEHIRYVQSAREDEGELIVPLRQKWCAPPPTNVYKLFLRGGLGPDIQIAAGNHAALQHGQRLTLPNQPPLRLAHYSRRNGYQNLQKIAIGRLKVLAAGSAATQANRSAHYTSPFETLRDQPAALLGNAAYLSREMPEAEMLEMPLPYRGGPLRYTKPADPALRAFRLGLHYAEQLARQHGRLLDQSAEARAMVEAMQAERQFLF